MAGVCVKFLQRAWGDKQDPVSRDDGPKDDRNQARWQQVQHDGAGEQQEWEPEEVWEMEEGIEEGRAGKKKKAAGNGQEPAVDAAWHVERVAG